MACRKHRKLPLRASGNRLIQCPIAQSCADRLRDDGHWHSPFQKYARIHKHTVARNNANGKRLRANVSGPAQPTTTPLSSAWVRRHCVLDMAGGTPNETKTCQREENEEHARNVFLLDRSRAGTTIDVSLSCVSIACQSALRATTH